MSRYFCHDHPEVLTLETRVIDARPGAVLLEASPFHPGGGGQLADRGRLAWHTGEARVAGLEVTDGRVWHLLDAPVEPSGGVYVAVDADSRTAQSELHTGAHILNALVYRHFNGALITGAQLGGRPHRSCGFRSTGRRQRPAPCAGGGDQRRHPTGLARALRVAVA